MKSTAANDNRRVKQTMLHYFKRVAIFRDQKSPNRNVRDTSHLLFQYHYFLKTIYFLSKCIRACNFVQVGVLKNIDFSNFTQTNFYILFCDRVPLNTFGNNEWTWKICRILIHVLDNVIFLFLLRNRWKIVTFTLSKTKIYIIVYMNVTRVRLLKGLIAYQVDNYNFINIISR